MEVDVLYNEDCLEGMQKLPDDCIDAVVTDPPYGLSFMGRKWDYDVPSVEIWQEACRVLKPGGHILAFGGTRTYHRMVVAIEDAGFEIRDQLMWIYGSGFPKSLDVSKAIDKDAGAERKSCGLKTRPDGTQRPRSGDWDYSGKHEGFQRPWMHNAASRLAKNTVTAPATPEAQQWEGWGTALKPSHEPIVLARKPLSERTVAANVLKHGTGAINIDGCRIEGEPWAAHRATGLAETKVIDKEPHNLGRWPANAIFDEAAGEVLDEQSLSGGMHSAGHARNKNVDSDYDASSYNLSGTRQMNRLGDSGGASRFFYCPKSSKSERGEGNNHPTVKPIRLMEYLVRLITPPGGVVLDPFSGSGTTLLACQGLGYHYIGFEKDPSYFDIAQKRIASHKSQLSLTA
jgi:DNA modification methylase